MADIAAVLGRLTNEELEGLRAAGPQGHLPRVLVDALDRAAGGPGAGRGYYVPTGSVSDTGGPHLVLRSDVANWLFTNPPSLTPPHEVAGLTTLRRGDRVEILNGERTAETGFVDDMTEDAAMVWVRLDGPGPRRVIHREHIRPM